MRMRLRFSTATILATVAVLSFAACRHNVQTGERTTAEAQAVPSDGVRRITISELRERLEKGDAVVIDVRGSVEYNLGHIKGARSVPLGLIAQQAGELPRDKLLVTYCA